MKIPVFGCTAFDRDNQIIGSISSHVIVGGELKVSSRMLVKYSMNRDDKFDKTPYSRVWMFYDVKVRRWVTGDETINGK